jgi:general secretion pathway protein D
LERAKVYFWIGVIGLAVIIIWYVGFHTPAASVPPAQAVAGGAEPAPADANTAADSNQPADSNAVAKTDANAPEDANESSEPNRMERPGRPPRMGRGGRPEPNAAGQARPADANAAGTQLEAVNLKDVEMKNVLDKIAAWTGKTVIPTEDAMKQKITIYAPEKMPRNKALAKIYSALRLRGFVAEEVDDTIFLKPIKEAKLGVIPTVGADEPLAMFENKEQIVRKFFKLVQYSPAQMVEIVKPMVGDYGYVGADEATGQLLVIETVGNLMSIGKTIAELDVPGAGKSVDQVFEIQYGDPAEIIQVIRLLMGDTATGQRGSATIGRPTGPSRSSSGGPVITGAGQTPLVLIPDPKRKCILARGSGTDIETVREWIKKLDREEPIKSEYETIPIRYADCREVAQQIEQTLANMPGAENLRPSIMVRPLQQSRQIMVIGRQDLREMVKVLINQIDMPVGTFETKVFPLQYADPDQIKANIESLYGQDIPGSRYSSAAYYYYYAYGPGRNTGTADTVKVISFATMKQVTVIASPENMRKIEKQIDEWDTPLDVAAVKPRIVELHNSDPVAMVKLLGSLFSDKEDSTSSLLRLLYYGDVGDQRKKIVGPLYGQLAFESVTGTKKIIIVSKIPAAYDVVEQLVYDLDRQEMGEIPAVVQLNYADAEDLAERLNATFNSEGTPAPIRRTAKGLTEYSMDQSGGNGGGGGAQNNNNQNNPNNANANQYTPPWSTRGGQRMTDVEPISNVIGRVRFIPDPRTKSLLVLAPREFQSEIAKTISQLDIPSKQVLIKAIVVEVDHSSMTSLGIELATNPSAFGNIGENAMTALGQVTSLTSAGSIAADNSELNPLRATGSGTISGGTSAVYALIDFLIKNTNAKILNQQTLWTEDNEEAIFFKGQVVAFTAGTVLTGAGASQQGIDYKDVGMVVQVRPSITPEKHVDLTVHLQMSQLTAEFVNGQPLRDKMDTSTNIIVQDGETVVLGGMLFQNDTRIKRKLPLLGDVPLLGGLFQHNSVSQANNELIVFVTPFVIEDVTALPERTKQQLEGPKSKLNAVQQQLNAQGEALEEDANKP